MTKTKANLVLATALVAVLSAVAASNAEAFSLKPPAWARKAWNDSIRDPFARLGDNIASLCTLEFTNGTDRTLLMSIGSSKEELVAPGGSVRKGVGIAESRVLTAKDPNTKAILYSAASSKATPGKTITRQIVVDKATGNIVSS